MGTAAPCGQRARTQRDVRCAWPAVLHLLPWSRELSLSRGRLLGAGRRRRRVRARWPQVVDFEKGEFVDGEEEEVLQLWPANYGCANKHNQWVVYDGKTGGELAAEANRDVVDLTLEEKMDDARRVAEALCAPATLA